VDIPKSKYLSWLLRHGGKGQGLAMDPAGWMSVDAVLEFSKISRAELELIVNTNQKHRFQLLGNSIRACQGHSLDAGVTREALEASWVKYVADTSIWHGTSVTAIEQIAREGIVPMHRTHVHCALTKDSAVGKRANVDVLLEISPAKIRAVGLDIFIAPNGVVLVRRVPQDAIIDVLPMTKKAGKRESAMRAALGFR